VKYSADGKSTSGATVGVAVIGETTDGVLDGRHGPEDHTRVLADIKSGFGAFSTKHALDALLL
jgi:hypothetical protein